MSLFSAFPSLNLTEMDLVQAMLFALAVLPWELLKWLKLIAGGWGCNPRRTKAINKLIKKLGYDPYDSERGSRMSKGKIERLDDDLKELLDADLFESPAKAGQSIRLIERLDGITKLLEARLEPPATVGRQR
jgi:hypothetical protein